MTRNSTESKTKTRMPSASDPSDPSDPSRCHLADAAAASSLGCNIQLVVPIEGRVALKLY